MAPGSTTLLPVLGAETLPGAVDLAQEALGAGAADETLGQAGSRVTGPRVDEPRARRLAGSATYPRVALRHDVTRFSNDSHPTRLLGYLGHVRPVDETRPTSETSARVDYPRVDRPGVGHSWPFDFVADIKPAALLAQSFAFLSPTLLPARELENSLPRPSLPQVHAPSSSDLIGEIFGGGLGSRESRPLPAPRVALTPSDVAAGPDVFRNRVVRRVSSEGDSPKDVLSRGIPPNPPRFSRVLDPLGTGEFIMNPLTSLLDLDEIQMVNPTVLEVMGIEDSATVTLRLAGLKTEIDQSIDDTFTGIFDEARAGLKLVYNEALTRVSRLSTRALQNGFVVLELQDVEALVTLAGVNYGKGRCVGVMELMRLIRNEILGPRGIQYRNGHVSTVLRLARLKAPSLADTGSRQGAAFSGVSSDARSSRPEERRDDESSDAADTPLVVGTTASAGANADAEDQGEQRDHPSNQ